MMDTDRIWILAARKLMGDATHTEEAELVALLEKHPAQKDILDQIIQSWNQESTLDPEFMEATYLAHLVRMEEKGLGMEPPVSEEESGRLVSSSRKRRLLTLWSLAGILVLAGAWLLIRSGKEVKTETGKPIAAADTRSEISTRNGNRTRIQLPDGSTVWLNAGSKLDYDKEFGNKLREVHLTGEGFFDVVKNPEKPFLIHTSAVDIKVLGTQFNVKSYPGDKTTETSLIRGSVEVFVKNRGERWVLRPNEKLVVENIKPLEGVVVTEKNKGTASKEPLVAIKELTYYQPDAITPVEASWTRNQLSFKDEPFSEVADKMERWYDVEFEFRNKSMEKMMVWGTFENETLEKALEALQFSFGFRYSIRGKKVIID